MFVPPIMTICDNTIMYFIYFGNILLLDLSNFLDRNGQEWFNIRKRERGSD